MFLHLGLGVEVLFSQVGYEQFQPVAFLHLAAHFCYMRLRNAGATLRLGLLDLDSQEVDEGL